MNTNTFKSVAAFVLVGMTIPACSYANGWGGNPGYWNHCDGVPVLHDSMDSPPLDVPLYVRGSHSGWAPEESYRLRYKGNNIYQVVATYSENFSFKIASGDESWSRQFWVPSAAATSVEQQGLELKKHYSMTWRSGTQDTNKLFVTGEMLFTFEIDPNATAGDSNAALLHVAHCDGRDRRDDALREADTPFQVDTVVEEVNANDGVSIGPDGDIYIANFGAFENGTGNGTQIYKVTPEGETSVYADGLTAPLGGYWDESGNLYVLSGSNGVSGEFVQIRPDGAKQVIAEIAGWPTDSVQDEAGRFYIGNFARPELTRVTLSGEQEVFASHPHLQGIVGIVYDRRRERVIGANYTSGRILTVNRHGEVSQLAQVPSGIGYIAKLGRYIYATGLFSNRVYRVSMKGRVEWLAGSGVAATTDGDQRVAQFYGPNGIAADAENRVLYISQFGEETALRRIDLNAYNWFKISGKSHHWWRHY